LVLTGEHFILNKLKTMREIRSSVLTLQKRLKSPDTHRLKTARQEYLKLMDRFYSENAKMIAPRQYKEARRDGDYFMLLIELALGY
jgi:hypothetical protein